MLSKSVNELFRAWIAAVFLGLLLTGCGGGSQPSSDGGQSAGSAALSWNAPLNRQNGDSLKMAELAGYIIRYGQDSENLTETVRINDASTMEHTVTNLGDGTWFFTVQVEDVNGLMSPPSAQVRKTI